MMVDGRWFHCGGSLSVDFGLVELRVFAILVGGTVCFYFIVPSIPFAFPYCSSRRALR